MVKIGVNGFGRIGRLVTRAASKRSVSSYSSTLIYYIFYQLQIKNLQNVLFVD